VPRRLQINQGSALQLLYGLLIFLEHKKAICNMTTEGSSLHWLNHSTQTADNRLRTHLHAQNTLLYRVCTSKSKWIQTQYIFTWTKQNTLQIFT